jgi:hypothetical protein
MNHLDGAEISTDFDPATRSLVFRSPVHVPAGEQIRMFYGPRSSMEFLLFSGFVPARVPADTVTVTPRCLSWPTIVWLTLACRSTSASPMPTSSLRSGAPSSPPRTSLPLLRFLYAHQPAGARPRHSWPGCASFLSLLQISLKLCTTLISWRTPSILPHSAPPSNPQPFVFSPPAVSCSLQPLAALSPVCQLSTPSHALSAMSWPFSTGDALAHQAFVLAAHVWPTVPLRHARASSPCLT